MKPILRLVGYYNKTITSHTTNIFTLTFQSLPETFIRRSLFSSSAGSCHYRGVMWQEISDTCGLACSCPRPGSRNVVPLSEHVLPLWSMEYFCRFSVQYCSGWPTDDVVVMRCMVSQCWFVLLRQTWCTLVSGKRFTSYGLHLRLMFFQSCTKLSSCLCYVTLLTANKWNFVHTICNFLLLLLSILWMTKVPDTDQNVKVRMLAVCQVIVSL